MLNFGNIANIGYSLKPIFDTGLAATKNDFWFKSDQKWLKNNHLDL